MNIVHIVFAPDSLTYMVARAMTSAGHAVWVCLTDPAGGQNSTQKIQQRLRRVDNVTFVTGHDLAVLPAKVDRVIIQAFPRPATVLGYPALDAIVGHARTITLVTAGDRSRDQKSALRLQWQELLRLKRWLRRIDRIVYKDGFFPVDLFSALLRRRSVAGFDVHSMFMDDESEFAHIQNPVWGIDLSRPIFINFMGSQDPAIRKSALDSIRHVLVSGTNITAKRVLWHEYSDAQPGALGLAEFVNALTDSDFTLCPPGYSLITHRPIEAMLRGSIPVLHENELDLYDIGLADGINCIAVRPGRWLDSVKRCAAMDEHSIQSMRRAIREIIPTHLHYDGSSRRMRQRFGLDA